jgi:hypothetical protein
MNRWSLSIGALGLSLALLGCGAAKKVGSGVSKIFGIERGVSKDQLKSAADEIQPAPQKVPPPPSPTHATSASTTERFGLVVEETRAQPPQPPAPQPRAAPRRKGMKAPFPLSLLQGDFGQTTPPGGEHFASAIATVAAKLANRLRRRQALQAPLLRRNPGPA